MNALTLPGHLPSAQWDLVSFFNNARDYAGYAGGGLIALLGTIMVIWGVVQLARKLLGGQNAQQIGWFSVIMLLLIGGALTVGGFVWVFSIAEGGKTTIDDLGGGFIMLQLQSLIR